MTKCLVLLICAMTTTLLLGGCHPPEPKGVMLTEDPIYSASLSPTGDLALISTANNGVQLWDLSQSKIRYQWLHGKDANGVVDVVISANQQFAASLSQDSVALWQISDGSSLGAWTLPSTGQSVAIADTGALLVGLSDGSVMSLTAGQKSLIQFLGHSEKVNSVALSVDGQFALSGANDKHVILWHAQTGQPIHTWQLASRVVKVALTDNGQLSFASDSTDQARIWDNQQGSELSRLAIYRRQMNFTSARFIQNDSLLVTGTPAREVILWRVSDGKKLDNWQAQLTKRAKIKGAVVYSLANHDREIISISSNGLVETWPMTH